MDYKKTAADIVELVGGKENISAHTHCMTRLRLVIKDESKVKEDDLKKLAGIQGISKGYYEAAEIDGASGWQKFVKITLPLLSPTIFYVVIMLIISTFQIFGEIYMMIGPKSQAIKFTQSVVMNFYRAAFTFSKKGYASAIAVLLFVIIMSLTVFQLKMQKKWVNYD